jgi:hypothetical protein
LVPRKKATPATATQAPAAAGASLDATAITDAAGASAGEAPAAEEEPDRKQQALDLVMETVEALFAERGAEEKIWGSMVKQALKRRKPGFNESYYGFRSFGKLLDEAQARKLVELEDDEKSGGVIIRGFNPDY